MDQWIVQTQEDQQEDQLHADGDKNSRLALLVLATIVAAEAKASLIVVDADAFPAGTVLNNAFPDVTLTAIGDSGVLANDNVLSATSPDATTGSRVFADTSGSPTSWGEARSVTFARTSRAAPRWCFLISHPTTAATATRT